VTSPVLLALVAFAAFAAAADPTDAVKEELVGDSGSGEEWSVGVLDLVVLAALAYGGYHYFFGGPSSSDLAADAASSYTIQPSMAPATAAASSSSSQDKGFISKMKHSKRRMVAFYGSQTGTAEEYASRLAKEGQKYGMRGVVADPEECDMEDLTQLKDVEKTLDGECLAVFCLATYGEGDPTDNAQEFFDWLQQGGGDMSGMKYAVFGLGNKTYEHFNAMAIYVDKRLEELGAVRIHPIGLGDDDANLEDDFITWKEAFWKSTCQEFNLEFLGEDFSMRQYEETVLKEGDYKPERVFSGEIARLRSYVTQRPPFDVKNPYMSPIKVNRNLHSDESDRYCMHLELDISGSRIRYDAGDHVAIYPKNDEELVRKIGDLLSIDLDTVFTMRATDEDATRKNPFPCPTTYRTALSHYVDITAIPRTHVLFELSKYTEDPDEKAKLELMSQTTPEGKDLYAKWVVESCRHITHILEDMPHCKPPIDHIMELLPRLQARFYSISSSSRVHPTSIHVTAVVVEYDTPTGRRNKGVATTWLKPMIPQVTMKEKAVEKEAETDSGNISEESASEEVMTYSKVPIYVRRSQFRLPNRPLTPVIMVGPGTGLAPFRGFIQERSWQKSEGKEVGETHFYFGCRNRNIDFIYQEELERFVESGVLTLHTAFSRDQAHKVYVTHLLRENAAHIWKLIGEDNGHFYICGDAKLMAKDVYNILVDIIKNHGGKSEEEALAYIKKMETQKRYSADVWS